MYIVFEGIDGCGKTTQIELLTEYMNKKNVKLYNHSEPSDTMFGKEIRNLFNGNVHIDSDYIDIYAFMLFSTDRIYTQNIYDGIKNKLTNGFTVISSRSFISSYVYNTFNVDIELIDKIRKYIIEPDVVFYIDIDIETSINRIHSRKESKEIYENTNKLKTVRKKYLEYIESNKLKNIFKINGNNSIDEIHNDIVSIIERLHNE